MEYQHRKMTPHKKMVLDYCPKCCGFLVPEDFYDKQEDHWLKFLKCFNCAWFIEIKTDRNKRRVKKRG